MAKLRAEIDKLPEHFPNVTNLTIWGISILGMR